MVEPFDRFFTPMFCWPNFPSLRVTKTMLRAGQDRFRFQIQGGGSEGKDSESPARAIWEPFTLHISSCMIYGVSTVMDPRAGWLSGTVSSFEMAKFRWLGVPPWLRKPPYRHEIFSTEYMMMIYDDDDDDDDDYDDDDIWWLWCLFSYSVLIIVYNYHHIHQRLMNFVYIATRLDGYMCKSIPYVDDLGAKRKKQCANVTFLMVTGDVRGLCPTHLHKTFGSTCCRCLIWNHTCFGDDGSSTTIFLTSTFFHACIYIIIDI